jgi:branched-subunit amino acid aminotransferase/4-amino-4-deoxychorismate lyase
MTLPAVAVSGRGLVDPAEPVFGADDEAMLRGAAAFETLRVYDGRPFLLEEHLERLRFSARALALQPPAEAARLAALVVSARPGDGVLRLYRSSRLEVATLSDLPAGIDEARARGLALHPFDVGASALLAGVKSTSYALPFAARRAAEAAGADDALLHAAGVVLETATANVFWRTGDTLCTPALGPGVLPGVTRAFVLGSEEVVEDRFPLDALAAADEAFTTSSIREVMPVVALDGQPIGQGKPGPTAARLHAALRLRSSL